MGPHGEICPMRPLWAYGGYFMDKVDRLIIKAKKAAQRKAERFYMGFVDYDPDKGKWIAKGDLWTGKRGGGRRITAEHDTKEAAVDALHALADEYPNTVEDAVIFIDDLTK